MVNRWIASNRRVKFAINQRKREKCKEKKDNVAEDVPQGTALFQ